MVTNGCSDPILNVRYLTRCYILDIPILHLLRHMTQNKATCYRLLQAVPDTCHWQDWILFRLNAVAETSAVTLKLVNGIHGRHRSSTA